MAFFKAITKNLRSFWCFNIKKPKVSQILLQIRIIDNRTLCRPIQCVIILMIKQIGLPLRDCLILFITCMITGRIGLLLIVNR